ncbi:bifunctional diguanylate cyclase/phosphodiesterase [Fusobacterium sp.]|uniref:sensor domain-containing protein n=1 Tax=Fusobacterium sp. TaxID=68766 RepID=UPI002612A5C9|nr:bifunctional diguanylate cyclase/phosphodiesterase [Fusobacterium sp.]
MEDLEKNNREKILKSSNEVKKAKNILKMSYITGNDNFDEIYDALEQISEDYIFIGNMKTMVFKYPAPFIKRVGFPTEIMQNPFTYWKNIIVESDWKKFQESTLNVLKGESKYQNIEFRVKDVKGNITWLRKKSVVIRDEFGSTVTIVGNISFLGKQNKIDPITGLMKITEFFKNFNKKLEKEYIENIGMMIIGVDDFEQINQLYSRQTGDRVLKNLANVIQYNIPDDISLYKLDGDNFGLILENVDKDEVRDIYSKIKDSLGKIHFLNEENVAINISAGCAIFPKNGITYQELYKFAVYSLLYCKKTGKNKLVFFSEEVIENKVKHFEILYFLKQSIDNNFENFEVFYQPQISTKTKKLKGFEALLRWKCEKYGNVSPVEFIPLLEETGLISLVGNWVLEQSLKTFKSWLEKYPDLKISVNLSCVQLINKNCIPDFKKILEENEFPRENIFFEITESTTVSNIKTLKEIYEEIKALGVNIALDDFGTGYSSFGILKEIPVDMVKIDRSFVKDILNSSFDVTFIKFITEICHNYGIKICIEGVERKEELDLLEGLNVDYIQGYYFGKPEPEKVISEKYLK